jgi:hypothetical protein
MLFNPDKHPSEPISGQNARLDGSPAHFKKI